MATPLLLFTRKTRKGQILLETLIFSSIAAVFITGLATWGALTMKAAMQSVDRERAVQIAEAGIDYYRWHLAHAPQDYKDGTNNPGPYAHSFQDKDGNTIGQFILNIIPPPVGSTLVTVQSTGQINSSSTLNLYRKLEAKLAIPSLAKYAVVANDKMRFGAGTEVFGPIHSNDGIHFDGLAHNVVSSAKSSYQDPDHVGGPDFGVHTHLSPADPFPPAAVPNRPDVFQAGRQFPVPAVDFAGMISDLATIKNNAQASGRYFAPSGSLGYHIILKTNGSFDLYKVNSLVAAPGGCSNNASGWGTWSISAGGEQFLQNYTFPTNGLIFTEDNLWIDGQINTARLTIAAGRFPDNPATRASITVNNNLTYTNYNGSDVIALIAQNNFNVGLKSLDTQRIDAALVAQNGRVGRYLYSLNCGTGYVRSTLTLYGMIATNVRYGFAYTCNCSGYTTRNIIYDANLLYGPPPSFPLAGNQYVTISWKEIK